jgi:beta-N-acetylhexosaminidase
MSAHIAFPALTGDSVPATLNPELLTGLLRRDLGFQGIAFTDAMDMGAIVNGWGAERSPVLALLAGADVLLQVMPDDVGRVIDAVVAAVQRGELSERQIETSVRRVLAAKERLGLHRGARVSLDELPKVVGTPVHTAVADTVAKRAITLVRDRDSLLPLRGRVLSVVYTDDYDPWTGRNLQRELASLLPGLRTASLTERATAAELASLSSLADSADAVLFAPFIRVRAAKGALMLPDAIAAWIRALAARKPLIAASFGNPYVLQQVPELSTYLLAWGGTDNAQRAAARALAGRAPITGRLPIPIPPLHGIGEGLQRSVVQGTR